MPTAIPVTVSNTESTSITTTNVATAYAAPTTNPSISASNAVATNMTAALETSTRPAHWATLIAQGDNLYQVDEMLYRSEQLEADDVKLLKELGIDTIINLRFFDRDDDQENLAEASTNTNPNLGVDGVGEVDSAHYPLVFVNQPLLTWWIKPKQLAQILHRIKDEQQRGNKVLVHCYHGADRTGVTVAMYRILRQGWTVEHAKSEMIQGGFGYHSIWKNIERLLTEEKVAEVRAELALLEPTVP